MSSLSWAWSCGAWYVVDYAKTGRSSCKEFRLDARASKIHLFLRFLIEGSLEVKLPTIWTDEKQSRAEAERRGRLEERRSEEKE